MNNKFFALPEEKQQRIINAGYHVFSRNSYKKSPVGEIAQTAGISKSLLFHYFHNKKELYFFLWDKAAEMTIQTINDYACYEPENLFEMMRRGMYAKLSVMRKYPELTAFTLKAFYEKDPEISAEIQKSYMGIIRDSAAIFMPKIHPEDFRPGLNLEMLIKTMYWTTEVISGKLCSRIPLILTGLKRIFWKSWTSGKSPTAAKPRRKEMNNESDRNAKSDKILRKGPWNYRYEPFC